MTIPRSDQINLNATTYYHVMNRCVRRSFLCGFDKETGKDFSHRKSWILSRLKFLASIFSIEICAFAIMSNHFHLILHVDEASSKNWSQKEIIERWKRLCPINANNPVLQLRKTNIWRERLSSISWFMKFLNQSIARRFNLEDNITGHFWEGRFKSQALLDTEALISAMVYVDLNPIRGGAAKTPESSDFTSIQERIRCFVKSGKRKTDNKAFKKRTVQPSDLKPFLMDGKNTHSAIEFDLINYLELVDATGRLFVEGKSACGKIENNLKPILKRLQINQEHWLSMVGGVMQKFSCAIGCEIAILDFRRKSVRFPKGRNFAAFVYQ